jgi:hypothetical protein
MLTGENALLYKSFPEVTMADRDERSREEMPAEERRRILQLLNAAVAAPVVTVLFHGTTDAWLATA